MKHARKRTEYLTEMGYFVYFEYVNNDICIIFSDFMFIVIVFLSSRFIILYRHSGHYYYYDSVPSFTSSDSWMQWLASIE